jgi:hypothetical protein
MRIVTTNIPENGDGVSVPVTIGELIVLKSVCPSVFAVSNGAALSKQSCAVEAERAKPSRQT